MINTAHPDALVIELDKPLEFAGRTADRLELKEPTVGQLRACEKFSKTEWGVNILMQVTGIPVSALDTLPVRKFKEAVEFIDGFFTEPKSTESQTAGG